MNQKRLNEIKSKLFKKCRTCEHYGPSMGVCFKQKFFTNRRGICADWEPLNDEELLEYSDKELRYEGFFEF